MPRVGGRLVEVARGWAAMRKCSAPGCGKPCASHDDDTAETFRLCHTCWEDKEMKAIAGIGGVDDGYAKLDSQLWEWSDKDPNARASAMFTAAGVLGSPIARKLMVSATPPHTHSLSGPPDLYFIRCCL